MPKRTDTPKSLNGSIILLSAARIQELYAKAEQRQGDADPNAEEVAEIAALTASILTGKPTTRAEASAVYDMALEHLQCLAHGASDFDGWSLYCALKASRPLLCAA